MEKANVKDSVMESEMKSFGSLCLRANKSSSTSPKGDRRLNPMNVDLVIKKLLSYLPIHELKAAREVNRHWNQIAAQFFYPFCSKVVLSFNDDNYWTNARNYGIEEMGDFVNLVAMSEQCPFSVFDLGTSIMSPAGREKTVAEFLRVCGPYMQVLTVREDSCRKIFRKGVPQDLCFDSLRSLRIHPLQSLDEEVLENFFDLINAIVQVSPNLESFALISHHGFDGGEAVDCLIQTLLLCDLERLSSLQIEAQVNETNLVTLSTLGLTLKHLRMDFWGSHLPSPHGMKVFLNSQSPTLETFKFSDAAMSSLALIEFPCMQELQLLKIKGSMLGRISVSFPHISFIDQFPKLKTLSFSELFGEWEEFLKTGMKPSLTVEELRLPADFVDAACLTRAAYLFPNLKKLEVPYNPMLIGVVYDLMPHLEELAINTRYVSLIDDAITGISTEVCEEANQHRCYDLVLKELDQFQNSKSILSLKNLKCLKLKCKRNSDPVEITDASFFLALFQMPKLVSLDFGLRPLMLSRQCMEEVKRRFSVVSLHIHQ